MGLYVHGCVVYDEIACLSWHKFEFKVVCVSSLFAISYTFNIFNIYNVSGCI